MTPDARRQHEQRKDALSAKVSEAERELAWHSAAIGGTRRALAAKVGDVRDALPAGRALVEFLFYQHYVAHGEGFRRFGAAVFTRDSPPLWVPLGRARLIRDTNSVVRHLIRTGESSSALATHLRFLYDQLWAPIAAALPTNITTVLLSPDGELNFLSFATLLAPNDQFLAQQIEIRYVASGRDLLAPVAAAPAARTLAIWAAPDFDAIRTPTATLVAAAGAMPQVGTLSNTMRGLDFRPLPGTALEARRLEQSSKELGFDRAILRLGSAATEEALRGLATPRVLHLATHGWVLPEAAGPNEAKTGGAIQSPMLRSGLSLAGARHAVAAWRAGRGPDISTDGILTAEEVSSLPLRGTELVVLSACDTGFGDARPGEGVMGLRRGFALAGAQNLLMTLWPIEDGRTVDLMLDFYREWRRLNSAPRALALVQRRWLETLRREKNLSEACRIAGPFILTTQGPQ